MSDQRARVQDLVERPSESLSVEIKNWINPDTLEGKEKIVQAALAIRNYNGGYLIIGFDNKTLEPITINVPNNVRELFHPDKIKGLIAKYASEPFEVSVEFPELRGCPYPVIVIPPGVRTPVATKEKLIKNGSPLISYGDVYIRTLRANNTPSTVKATYQDWAQIMEICFDNREADIGRFFRRHLSGLTPDAVQNIAAALFKGVKSTPTTRERLDQFLADCSERFLQVRSEKGAQLPDHGEWEVALLLSSDAVPSHSASQDFLRLIDTSNPQYVGWPIFLVSSNYRDPNMRPYHNNGAWEEFIFQDPTVVQRWGMNRLCDFVILNPQGRFYHRRTFQEDASTAPNAPGPLEILDFVLPVFRTTEAIAVGLSIGKAMGFAPEKTLLSFAFRWTKLRGRRLVSWNPARHFWEKGPAYQDAITTHVDIPLDAPLSVISEFVERAVQPLFNIFDGYAMAKPIFEDLTRQLLERKL